MPVVLTILFFLVALATGTALPVAAAWALGGFAVGLVVNLILNLLLN